MKRIIRRFASVFIDPLLALIALPVAAISRLIRAYGIGYLPLTRRAFEAMGAFPIRRHYYEPLFHPDDLRAPLDQPRSLPGVDLRIPAQRELLRSFRFQIELAAFPMHDTGDGRFYYANGAFESGDAELWYSMIRHLRPRTIIEVGSGMSTKLAIAALDVSRAEDPQYAPRHVCIEPYLAPWLETAPVEVLRQRVEDVDPAIFAGLGPGDILFIDSSHIIRPQGDVLHLYLSVLPTLAPGVIVHVHDIFTPRDYPRAWVVEQKCFWNEQYLVEALLTVGARVEVLLAANALAHDAPDALAACAPIFAQQRDTREPGSLYLRVV